MSFWIWWSALEPKPKKKKLNYLLKLFLIIYNAIFFNDLKLISLWLHIKILLFFVGIKIADEDGNESLSYDEIFKLAKICLNKFIRDT